MADTPETKERIDVNVPDIPVTVHAQYVKDFSFENPNAPASLRPSNGQPNMDINIAIDAVRVQDDENADLYESAMTLTVKATREGKTMFIAQVVYAALVTIKDAPAERINPILYVDLPQMMFPFARHLVAQATGSGGFPPLMMNPIDFRAMYLSQKQAQQEMPKAAVN
jgi:preprotein translocase subunit SecB